MAKAKPKLKVLVSDSLPPEGLKILTSEKSFQVDDKPGLSVDELKSIIGEYDGIVIRSGTKLTADVLKEATNLKAIARAGVGVDNVDVPTATQLGIVVMNTPDANTISTAELTMALLLALARKIHAASASLKGGQWDRKSFKGTQLAGKTLGVIGLGRIGTAVALRSLGFEMKVIGYDPFFAGSKDLEQRITVVKNLDDLVTKADIITVHVPKSEDTVGMIGAEQLGKMKKGVMLINAARGGIINEGALYDALESGKVAGAALDVFVKEPPEDRRLADHPKVLAVPHLGAQTAEAQLLVAQEAAQIMADFLTGRGMANAVNMPAIDFARAGELRPYLQLGQRLGMLLGELNRGRMKKLTVNYGGAVCELPYRQATIAIVMGLLHGRVNERLTMVNAMLVAKDKGVEVVETLTEEHCSYVTAVEAVIESDKETHSMVGTLLGGSHPRIVRVDGIDVEVPPEGNILMTFHEDRPGVIGHTGTVLAEQGVNIAYMTCGRQGERGQEATLFITLDSAPKDGTLAALNGIKGMHRVLHVALPPLDVAE
ncbi:MAG: phosphoglycerate dehydrogenase [Phycisphaerae bacterium]|nr:phosphoglycerate dehydrogenase [Phycisphaerae bacterium]